MLICLLTCIHLYLISGNIPVDCAVFLGNAALPIINGLTMYTPPDFVPGSHQYLLSILSTWWCFGQLLGNLVGLCSYLYRFLELITNKIAWPLITNYSCTSTTDCNLSSNMGWRYLLFCLGGLSLLLWSLRFFVFSFLESPRFLSGIGKDAEAVDVICELARCNGRPCPLTVKELEAPGKFRGFESSHGSGGRRRIISEDSGFAINHVKALFSTPKMAWSTSLLIAIWGQFVKVGHRNLVL